MKLFVKTLYHKTIVLNVDKMDTIYLIKLKIQDKENIPIESQRLLFQNTELINSDTLVSHNIGLGSALKLLINE